jgi:iron-sulfur cluster repair protein YtfE (RIC family)
MLVQLGRRTRSTDVVDALYECHGRIRQFLQLAQCLAVSRDLDDVDVRSLTAPIIRYFTVGFPMHVADENDSIFPRLAGRSEQLDAALAQVRADHDQHEHLDRLVAICREMARDPRQHAARSNELAATTERLTLDLEAHLALEELTIFPALRDLRVTDRATIQAEMRRRRDAALGSN